MAVKAINLNSPVQLQSTCNNSAVCSVANTQGTSPSLFVVPETNADNGLNWKNILAGFFGTIAASGVVLSLIGRSGLTNYYQKIFNKLNPGNGSIQNFRVFKDDNGEYLKQHYSSDGKRLYLSLIKYSDPENVKRPGFIFTSRNDSKVTLYTKKGDEFPHLVTVMDRSIAIDYASKGTALENFLPKHLDTVFFINEKGTVKLPFNPVLFFKAGLASLQGKLSEISL